MKKKTFTITFNNSYINIVEPVIGFYKPFDLMNTRFGSKWFYENEGRTRVIFNIAGKKNIDECYGTLRNLERERIITIEKVGSY